MPGQIVGRSPYLQPVQVDGAGIADRRDRAGDRSPKSGSNSLFGTLAEAPRRPSGSRGGRADRRALTAESLMPVHPLGPGQGLGRLPRTSPATQIVLAFDDNRLASALFGQYGQNLALIERRLGVVAEQRGNHVTLDGSRDACEQARRVLEGLYEQLKRGQRSRARRRRGRDPARDRARLAVRLRSGGDARGLRGDQPAQAPGARAHRRAGRLYPRAAAARAGVRHRPRRHRQDLARGRACGAAVRAQGGRPHHPVAAGGRGRRAARLPARRHAREGRSLSAADLRRAATT